MNLDDLDVEPDGAQLLDDLRAALTRYVVLPSAEATDAISLWIAATHAQTAWEHATRLVATSPEKRCGKSRLLDIIEATSHAPLITVNISAAALARSVGEDPPTLILDEADTVFGKSLKGDEKAETLRGLINAGHQRNRPYIRWDAVRREREPCPTFAMAALAGIGDLPDTITDRAVVIPMRRRAPGETVAAFRTRRDMPPLHDLRDRLNAWLRPQLDKLRDAEPDLPADDRAADNWTPLVAIADLAAGQWPGRARAACLALTGQADTDTSAGIRLLADLRAVFGDRDSMHGAQILDALHKIEEAPWGDWYGRALNARELAKLLRPYTVTPADVKIEGITRRGYYRAPLADAWKRYLDQSPGGSATSATCATSQVRAPNEVAGSTSEVLPATGTMPLTSTVAEVAQVADNPHCGQCGAPISALRYAQAGPLCGRCETAGNTP